MDRRVVYAILLMLAVMIVPAVLFRRPATRPASGADTVRNVRPESLPRTPPALTATPQAPTGAADSSRVPEDTITVSGPLYRYAFSTRGGRMIEATLLKYHSMRPDERGQLVQILQPGSELLGLSLLVGTDTISLKDWHFTPSAPSLNISEPTPLSFTAQRGALSVTLSYRFTPNDYLVDVGGKVDGAGPNGAVLLISMGPGLRNTESDSVEHHRELAVVVKDGKANLTRFTSLTQKAGDVYVPRLLAFNGPFEWVAVKSKYFVTALLALDTTGTGRNGGIGGASAVATDTLNKSHSAAAVTVGLPVPGGGGFRYQLYAGPMEYPRLQAIGHDFDDVNPYGWPGFRTSIRPGALGARSLLVWLHDTLGLAYGMGLVLFGVVIRLVLWPLNQKAMRSTMAMQAVQPLMKELQEK